jgi:hypothetical protein
VLAFVAAADAGERHRELAGPEPLPMDELHLHECRPIVHSNAFGLLCFDLLVTGRINDRAPARSYRRVSQRHMTCGRTWAPLAIITCTRFSLDSGCDSLTPEASNEVEHEDNVINQRLSWFVAAHTFLFSHTRYFSMRYRTYVYKASLHNEKSSFFSSWSPLV